MNVAVLRPVWRSLAHDPRVTLAFVAEHPESVGAALSADGLAAALLARSDAAWRRWDLVLTADAWNHAPLRRCRRRMQFFHGVAGKYDLDDPSQLAAARLDRFDRVAFINDDRMERYVGAGIVSRQQAVLVGYPKLDDLLNGHYSAPAVRDSFGLDASRPTILFAPTFSVAGALHLAGEAIIRTLLDQRHNVIVKLHDRSMTPDGHHTAGIDWPQRLAAFAPDPRFALARVADITPLLAAADLLVTDHSTVGFEFALLDRPIVVYDAPDLLQAARIEAGKWSLLRSMADVVRTPAELAAAVPASLAAPARLAGQRRRARTLFASPGAATARALATVYELLELSPPATLQQRDTCSVPVAADARG